MGFKNFRFQIILRVLGITFSSVGFAWSIYRTDFLMTPIVFGLVTLIQLIALIHYSEWTIRELKRFLDSFIDSDYTRRFERVEKGKVFDQLDSTFNQIVEDFKRIRIEKEEHYQYLLQVNHHVKVGLICFTSDGRIDLMNSAARELLDYPVLTELRMIKNHDPKLFHELINLNSGNKTLFKKNSDGEQMDLAMAANKFKLGDKEYTLISIQNIRAELDEQEMLAWQKLIRVLTHEIMNSVTPVVSLTTAIKTIIESEQGFPKSFSSIDNEQALDIYKSINAIESRGKGLLDFVNAYRDYTKEPEPELNEENLVDVVDQVLQVLKLDLKHVNVVFEKPSYSLCHSIDRKLIDQVLINLIKNAVEATSNIDLPTIEIVMKPDPFTISVFDNGPGIPEEIKEQIFVPFYTTKEKGNGIGLSLSKQIMKAHNGSIQLNSTGEGTEFILKF